MSKLYKNPLTSTLFHENKDGTWFVKRKFGWSKVDVMSDFLKSKLILIGINYNEHH